MKKSEIILELLVGVTALGALVAGGALFAFSSFVMPALPPTCRTCGACVVVLGRLARCAPRRPLT